MIAWESCSEVCGPKFMVPRQTRLTCRPERPRWVYCMRAPGGVSALHLNTWRPGDCGRAAGGRREARGLLVAQRVDGVEPGGTEGGEKPGEHAHHGGGGDDGD